MDGNVALVPDALQKLTAPHVDSFNEFLNVGVERVVASLGPVEIPLAGGSVSLSVNLVDLTLGTPQRDESRTADHSVLRNILPREARQLGTSYIAPLTAHVTWRLGDSEVESRDDIRFGNFPVMVRAEMGVRNAANPHR